MAQVSVEIPAPLVAPLRESGILLYQATAEALHHALRVRGGPAAALDEVDRHRDRLSGLDAMIGQLGWSAAPVPEAVTITAPSALLHDAVYGALIDAGERLAAACGGRVPPPSEAVGVAAARVIGLDRLLRRVEAGPER